MSGTPPNRTLRSAADLVAAGFAPPETEANLAVVAARYAIGLTPEMAVLISPDDPKDPIGRQFLPDPAELETRADEASDPIGDAAHAPVKGIVHRYPDRVLLKPTHACPVYCRFCFRREAVGPGGESLDAAGLAEAIAYIRMQPSIREVILSGGDPLVLSARRLGEIASELSGIPHLDMLRIHTRVPLVDPGRVTAELVSALKRRLPIFVVLHANHPREFAPAGQAACARLIDAGIPMLGQSVLLRGVNDDTTTLEALMRAFLAARIKPYYLHHLDQAPGTARFRVPVAEAQALVGALRGRISGLAQPTYVVDIPGGHGKVPIGPAYLEGDQVRDPFGGTHPAPL